MPYRNLDRHFSRRMLPMAVAAGLVVATVPPLSYAVVTWSQLEDQAAIYAGQLASGVQTAAEHQPYLWRYNTPKVLWATAGHRGQRDIGAVTVTDCSGTVLFGPEALALGTGRRRGPTGWAPVHVGRQVVARVSVTLDHRAQIRHLIELMATSGVVGVLIGLSLYLFPTRVVRRQADQLADTVRRLEEAEARLTTANVDLAGKVRQAVDEVRVLSKRVVSTQEEERLRIARDLHDGVGQALTALQIEIQLAEGRPEEAVRHLAEAGRLAEEILTEIRSTVSALRPAQIGAEGIGEALRSLVERFEVRTGIPSSFRVQGDPSLISKETATCLLRILQEALTNVSRHAQAGEVGVLIRVEDRAVVLEVADDGKGFDPAGVQSGSGIRGIRERAEFLDGKLDLESAAGGGTCVRVTVPISARG